MSIDMLQQYLMHQIRVACLEIPSSNKHPSTPFDESYESTRKSEVDASLEVFVSGYLVLTA